MLYRYYVICPAAQFKCRVYAVGGKTSHIATRMNNMASCTYLFLCLCFFEYFQSISLERSS